MRDCHRLGILVHGTFIVGLPGETRETIERTIAFAKEIDPYSLQVSLAAPYPGTELYRAGAARTAGCRSSAPAAIWCRTRASRRRCCRYDELSSAEMHAALERFYRAYYLRPRPILRIVRDMVRDREVMVRRLREAREFFSFMAQRRQPPATPARMADGATAVSH